MLLQGQHLAYSAYDATFGRETHNVMKEVCADRERGHYSSTAKRANLQSTRKNDFMRCCPAGETGIRWRQAVKLSERKDPCFIAGRIFRESHDSHDSTEKRSVVCLDPVGCNLWTSNRSRTFLPYLFRKAVALRRLSCENGDRRTDWLIFVWESAIMEDEPAANAQVGWMCWHQVNHSRVFL